EAPISLFFRDIVFCRPTGSEILYKQIRGRGTRLCAGKRSFLMLDFVGNSVRFNEGYVPPKEEPLDPELGGSHRRGGGTQCLSRGPRMSRSSAPAIRLMIFIMVLARRNG
ncbi:MAG: hypothetical protein KAS60_08110, partial [Thermoplasmata archaeon]|nr:hypothetical protein [Thermoplasmata archaeon]